MKRLPLILIIYRNQRHTSLKKSLKYSIFTKRTQTLKGKPSFQKNGVIIADDTDIVFPNVDKNSKTITNKPQKYKEPNKSFHQYMKKDQNLPNKTGLQQQQFRENHSRTIQNYTRNQSPYNSSYRGRSPETKKHAIIHHKITTIDQIVKITTPDHIQIHNDLFLDLILNQEITTIQTTNHEIHHTIGIETTPIIEIEVIQTTETRITRTIDQGITHIIDRTITDQTTIIKIDREIIHKIDTQVIIIVIEIIPNHHTGIIITIIILIIATEVVHLNIKDILIKYNLIQKQHQTLQVLMTQ